MIGRAGRYGEDTDGESYLLCQPSEKHQVQRMFAATVRRPFLRNNLEYVSVDSEQSEILEIKGSAIEELPSTRFHGRCGFIRDRQF